MKQQIYDVIVVGAGHAGVEAALACHRLGKKTLVATTNLDRIAYMSCNPSIGGLAKGHIVREIDALGGEMARAADQSCVQFKRLNARKGPAARGSRAQCDKDVYSQYMAEFLKAQENVGLLEIEVKRLVLEGEKCVGVVTADGTTISSHKVIITTGTFMRGIMHIGLERIEGGRVGDKATVGISDQLMEAGFSVTRLKTGTPPRLRRDSINWEQMIPQEGDPVFRPFSFKSEAQLRLPQLKCFLTYTNEATHEIIRRNLDKSPMFCGLIEGIGPRYCPSIEDKITRFADKQMHSTFLEPEGLNSDSIYLQGISTSLPEDVQYEFLRTIPGLENVKMIRPGYAVEYDFIEPTQIWHSLETRLIKNLYLAGQINGTSGYEEAACQGLMAGLNACLSIDEKEPLILGRDEAYTGVLIDDLVLKGTREPYRMMTSRAEHRLVLREDNNLDRLLPLAKKHGLIKDEDLRKAEDLLERRSKLKQWLQNTQLVPNETTQGLLQQMGTPVLNKPIRAADLLRRSEVCCEDLTKFGLDQSIAAEVSEPVEIEIKYEGYISRQNELIGQLKRLEKTLLPADLDFRGVRGLSNEEVEKLSSIRPRTLGQAQRISGVNPSAIQALVVHLKGNGLNARKQRMGRSN